MVKRQLSILTIIFFGVISCRNSSSEKQNGEIFNSPQDSKLYENYLNAIENSSTFQYFTVVKVKDINTGKTREICTKGNFLWGALHIQYDPSYSSDGLKKIENMLMENRQRYFQLKDTAALNNLGINKYSMEDLTKFESENNVDSIAKSIKGKWGIAIAEDKDMLLLAHSLFNRGILTGENNCFGGSLVHIDKKMINERKVRIEDLKALSKKQ